MVTFVAVTLVAARGVVAAGVVMATVQPRGALVVLGARHVVAAYVTGQTLALVRTQRVDALRTRTATSASSVSDSSDSVHTLRTFINVCT